DISKFIKMRLLRLINKNARDYASILPSSIGQRQ
ncbi:MAG: hypothetical protein ACI9FB_003835, partial [Candidatus Azotimanducaceae bacterium]